MSGSPNGSGSSSSSGSGSGSRIAPVLGVLLVSTVFWLVFPGVHDASERGRQRRSMSDLRSLGTAVESYQIDHGFVPAAESVEDLRASVEPTYIRSLPAVDGWGERYRYRGWREDDGVLVAGPANSYVLCSAGSDRAFEVEDPHDYRGGAFEDRRSDIVYGGYGEQQPRAMHALLPRPR